VLPPYADGPGGPLVRATALFALAGAGFAVAGVVGAGIAGALAFVGYASVRVRIRVGSDGVRLPPWHDGRFVGYGELERVGTTERGVTLETRDGDTYYLPTNIAPDFFDGDRSYRERRELLAVEVEQRARTWRSLGEAPHAELLEARGDETTVALVARLRGVGGAGGATDYRAAAIPADLLWAVLEHPRASERARTAAAIVLAASEAGDAGAGSTRDRLRAADAASAAPRFRALVSLLLRRGVERISDEELAEKLPDH